MVCVTLIALAILSVLNCAQAVCNELKDGLVVIDVLMSSSPGNAGTNWVRETSRTGFLGSAYYVFKGPRVNPDKTLFTPLDGTILKYEFNVRQAGLYDISIYNLKAIVNPSDCCNDVFLKFNNGIGTARDGFNKFYTNQKSPTRWTFDRLNWENVPGKPKFSPPEIQLQAGLNTVYIGGRSGNFAISQIRIRRQNGGPADWKSLDYKPPSGCGGSGPSLPAPKPTPMAPTPAPTPKQPTPAPKPTPIVTSGVSLIKLINADNDQEVRTIRGGETVAVPNFGINFVAETTGNVARVTFTVTAPGNPNGLSEGVKPFAAFGDINGNFNAVPALAGTWTITATPNVGQAKTVTFKFGNQASPTPPPTPSPTPSPTPPPTPSPTPKNAEPTTNAPQNPTTNVPVTQGQTQLLTTAEPAKSCAQAPEFCAKVCGSSDAVKACTCNAVGYVQPQCVSVAPNGICDDNERLQSLCAGTCLGGDAKEVLVCECSSGVPQVQCKQASCVPGQTNCACTVDKTCASSSVSCDLASLSCRVVSEETPTTNAIALKLSLSVVALLVMIAMF